MYDSFDNLVLLIMPCHKRREYDTSHIIWIHVSLKLIRGIENGPIMML